MEFCQIQMFLVFFFLLPECYLLAQSAPRKTRPVIPAFKMDFVNVGMVFLICFASSRFSSASFQHFSWSWGKESNTLMLGSLEVGELIPEQHYFNKIYKVLILMEE